MLRGPIQRSTPNVNWPPFLLNLVSNVHKRRIDPKRPARVYRGYDVGRGYEHYGDFCQQRFDCKSQAWPTVSQIGLIDYTNTRPGGVGAGREVCDLIVSHNQRLSE